MSTEICSGLVEEIQHARVQANININGRKYEVVFTRRKEKNGRKSTTNKKKNKRKRSVEEKISGRMTGCKVANKEGRPSG